MLSVSSNYFTPRSATPTGLKHHPPFPRRGFKQCWSSNLPCPVALRFVHITWRLEKWLNFSCAIMVATYIQASSQNHRYSRNTCCRWVHWQNKFSTWRSSDLTGNRCWAIYVCGQKTFYTSLSTPNISFLKSTRTDVNIIRFYCETEFIS